MDILSYACVCVYVRETKTCVCVCVRAGLSARQPDFECLLAAVVRRGEARYSNFVSQFEYTLCTYQMRAQMRRLVNRICFSLSLFLQEQRERGGEKTTSTTCCKNSVFHLSARRLKPEHSGEHRKDKMPCQAVSSSSPLTFLIL